MKVNLAKEPITAEALETRLRAAKNKAAGVHSYLTAAVTEFQQTYSGAELQVVRRDIETLENLLDMALRYAEALADEVRKEVERIEVEESADRLEGK